MYTANAKQILLEISITGMRKRTGVADKSDHFRNRRRGKRD